MTILIYGFEPFGGYTRNITQDVLEIFPFPFDVVGRVFKVRFAQRQFIKTILETRADLVIGMGQCRSGSKIRIERRAMNWMRMRPRDPLRPIDEVGRSSVNVNLKIPPNSLSRLSYNAGTYVCNFSMYTILTDRATKELPFAFLHIPSMLNRNSVVGYLEDLVATI